MAIANPLLAGWDTNGNIRTFEYSAGVFVSIGNAGGYPHQIQQSALDAGADPYPFLAWDHEDNVLIFSRIYNNGGYRAVRTFSPTLVALATETVILNTGDVTATAGGASYSRLKHEFMFQGISTVATSLVGAKIASDGGITPLSGVGTTTTKVESIATTADGKYLIRGRNDASGPVANERTDETPAYVAADAPVLTIKSNIVKTNRNNRAVIFVDESSQSGKIYAFDTATEVWEYIHDLFFGFTPTAVVFSPDGIWLAVGSEAGTQLFKRRGDVFSFHSSLAGFGRLLSFSGDSVLLVDAGLRKAFLLNGDEWTAHDECMVNIPTLIVSQALSQGRVLPAGDARVYDAAIAAAGEGGINWNNLKLTLLTASAVVDLTDGSLDVVTNLGAWEVSTGDWPAGGYPLTNVLPVETAGMYTFTADPIEHTVFTSNLFARYAVIYDDISDTPISLIDFGAERSIVSGREAVISFVNGAFFRFQG